MEGEDSMFTLPEYEIIIEDEKIELNSEKLSSSDEAELKEFEKILQAKNPTFQNDDAINQSLEESVSDVKEDKMFFKFKEKITSYPDQVLRYGKGETPLWVSDSNKPSSVPDCENCGSKRKFEFQVQKSHSSFFYSLATQSDLILVFRLCLRCLITYVWIAFLNKGLTGVLCLYMFVKKTVTTAHAIKMSSCGNKIFLGLTASDHGNKITMRLQYSFLLVGFILTF